MARKLSDLREEIAACEAEIPPGPSQLSQAMVAHVRGHYCDDDESSRALLLASIESPEALADYRAFVADQLGRLERIEGACPGEGAVLFFAILGCSWGGRWGFMRSETTRYSRCSMRWSAWPSGRSAKAAGQA